MGQLTRVTSPDASRTRLVFVRRPYKSVRAGDQPDPLPVRLAIGVIAGVGAAFALWLIGTLGFHLGFAPRVHLPGLEPMVSGIGGGLVAGAQWLIALPAILLRAGMADPLWLMIGFALIAVPAAAMAGVRPGTPGGPRPHVLSVVFANTVAIAACVNAVVVIAWLVSPLRAALLEPMPLEAAAFAGWLDGLRLAAGLDGLAAIAAGLWVVLMLRVAVPRWLRGLAGSVAVAALAIVLIAMSMSGVTASQIAAARPVVESREPGTGNSVLLLGAVGGASAALTVDEGLLMIELLPSPPTGPAAPRQSMAGFIGERVPPPEF